MGSEAEAKGHLKELEDAMYQVTRCGGKGSESYSGSALYNLYLAAGSSCKLGFSVKKNHMSVAQGLYEGWS